MSQLVGNFWHPHPDRLKLWEWPLGPLGFSWSVHRAAGTVFLMLVLHLYKGFTLENGQCFMTSVLTVDSLHCLVGGILDFFQHLLELGDLTST